MQIGSSENPRKALEQTAKQTASYKLQTAQQKVQAPIRPVHHAYRRQIKQLAFLAALKQAAFCFESTHSQHEPALWVVNLPPCPTNGSHILNYATINQPLTAHLNEDTLMQHNIACTTVYG